MPWGTVPVPLVLIFELLSCMRRREFFGYRACFGFWTMVMVQAINFRLGQHKGLLTLTVIFSWVRLTCISFVIFNAGSETVTFFELKHVFSSKKRGMFHNCWIDLRIFLLLCSLSFIVSCLASWTAELTSGSWTSVWNGWFLTWWWHRPKLKEPQEGCRPCFSLD